MGLVFIAGTLVSEDFVAFLKNRCLSEVLSIEPIRKSTMLFPDIDGQWEKDCSFQFVACVLQTTSQEAEMGV